MRSVKHSPKSTFLGTEYPSPLQAVDFEAEAPEGDAPAVSVEEGAGPLGEAVNNEGLKAKSVSTTWTPSEYAVPRPMIALLLLLCSRNLQEMVHLPLARLLQGELCICSSAQLLVSGILEADKLQGKR